MELCRDKSKNYEEFKSDEEWFYNQLKKWYPNWHINWNCEGEDKYLKYDFLINCYCRIEFESSTTPGWTSICSPPQSWYEIHLLSRKCEADYWDYFIKVSEDKSTYWVISQKTLQEIKGSVEYQSGKIVSNTTGRKEESQNRFECIPLSFLGIWDDFYFSSDFEKLKNMIYNKSKLVRKVAGH